MKTLSDKKEEMFFSGKRRVYFREQKVKAFIKELKKNTDLFSIDLGEDIEVNIRMFNKRKNEIIDELAGKELVE